ncbi:NUC185 domain-containing protein [Haematococcus lacustris]
MLTGRGVSLESQFRLTYSMILNLMRVEDLKVEDMMKRSFAEFRAARSAPQALAALQAVSTALDRLAARPWPTCPAGCSRAEVEQYHALSQQVQGLNAALQPAVLSSRAASSLLTPGRLLLWSNPISGITEPAVYLGEVPPSCRPPTPPAAAAGLGGSSPLKLSGSGQTLGDSPGRQGGGGGGGGEGAGERRLALLVLHRPGPVDSRHLVQQAALRAELEPPAATKAKQPVQDEFAGMVMAAGKGGGKGGLGLGGGRGGKGGGPGPLPRYGACGGHDFMLADAGLAEVVGLGRGKIKVDAEEVLDGSWGEAGAGDQALSPSLRAALAAALRALAKEVEAAGGGRGTGADLPLLDPRIDLKVNDIDTLQGLAQRDSAAEKRATLRPHRCLALSEQLGVVRAESALRSRRDQLMHSLSDASLQALPEFELRVAVLQQLGYLDADNAVTLKGRVLCEINSTQDELVACELVFSGLLAGLSPAEAVALVSALVFQEKSDVEPQLTPDLAAARKQLTQLTRTTAQVQAAAGLALDPEEHCTAVLHCGLMQVVYEWAIGTPFVELCELTDVMEGSIVRAVVRLDQACRELQDAARVMGNTALFQQMQAASAAIKRDVVFAASLYVA